MDNYLAEQLARPAQMELLGDILPGIRPGTRFELQQVTGAPTDVLVNWQGSRPWRVAMRCAQYGFRYTKYAPTIRRTKEGRIAKELASIRDDVEDFMLHVWMTESGKLIIPEYGHIDGKPNRIYAVLSVSQLNASLAKGDLILDPKGPLVWKNYYPRERDPRYIPWAETHTGETFYYIPWAIWKNVPGLIIDSGLQRYESYYAGFIR